ncbi:MAG: HAMP domain-containing protein [Propionibacteriales bacterium]|nr:HAMP domain-containing protein [Propionibacteriales bacterium]
MIIVTAFVVAGVLAIGGVLILLAIRAELVDAADAVGDANSFEIAQLAHANDLPRIVPVMTDPEIAVQVVSNGRVLAESMNIRGSPELDLASPRPGETDVLQVESLPHAEEGRYRVTARGIVIASGTATIYVAVSIEDVEDTMSTATRALAIGLALLVLVLCGVMWVIIGRTLAPVERIRQQASAITGRHLDRRVLEPMQQDEIGRLARTVNAMLARLQDSAERQSRFVADAAHELRSPVASLRTQLETAGEESRVNGNGVSVPDLLQETVRMQTMVDRLLLLARGDAGELAPHRIEVDLDDIIDDVVSSLANPRVPIDQTQVQPAQVPGDPGLLEQVVRNLVENAVRHARSEVRVGLASSDGEVVLFVDDDGAGIPVERRSEVFERFTRLDVARDRHGGGVGLGLAIVAEIVQAHGGSIELDRAPIDGARFRVRLPMLPAILGR